MPLEAQGEPLFAELKNLLLELSRMNIAEFELEYRDIRILVRKNGNGAPKARQVSVALPEKPVASPQTIPVTTPLTGIFYLTPSPTADPFVKEGDIVEEGHVVGLVEAMKVFNEIKVEWSGRVVRVHARSGELVHAGQTLLELAPLS